MSVDRSAVVANVSAINSIDNKVYAFDGITGEVDILHPMTGDTTPVTTLNPAIPIAGAAAARRERSRDGESGH
ncbi:MAG: hypothetical protein JO336_01720 [Acidobacteriia bacterium]|nr:hypothetical protein [Terriglobia bacterium]